MTPGLCTCILQSIKALLQKRVNTRLFPAVQSEPKRPVSLLPGLAECLDVLGVFFMYTTKNGDYGFFGGGNVSLSYHTEREKKESG